MHQLCLVSEQPMPNFLAAIEPSLGVNRVTLAVTGKMEDRATWLEEALHRHQIETDRLPIVIHTDFEGMWTTFAEWAEAHKGAVLNVTGGTKLMAIAAQDASARRVRRCSTLTWTQVGGFGLRGQWTRRPKRSSQAVAQKCRRRFRSTASKS